MLSSIKWKFIVVYFLLVFVAMIIVGVFIVMRLETQQMNSIQNSMEQQLDTLVSSSSYLTSGNWFENRENIQNVLNQWRIGSGEAIYAIYNEEVPTILAGSSKQLDRVIGQNALSYRLLDTKLVLTAFSGEKAEDTIINQEELISFKHIAKPVFSSEGKLSGVLYMTSDLTNVENTLKGARSILINATLIALVITVVLGFMIASSITEPIRDVTEKAEKMSRGDFDQYVAVKSDDEIGQLASMFNHLTVKLKDTIEEMDVEKNKLDTIFSYMAEGVLAVDKNWKLIHANPIGIKLLGISEKELEEGYIVDPEYLNVASVDYSKPETLRGESLFYNIDGVFKVKYAPYKNEGEYTEGIIMVYQDITQEHRLDGMRKEFVANVSHELKTPITTIKSYAETLLTEDVTKEINEKFLQVIDSECDRMARLVRDLLQLSNLDYKKIEWVSKKLDLKDILKSAVAKLEIMAKEKNLGLKLNLEDSLSNVNGDKDGIEQVILNILSNAIKYTDNDGEIKIDAFNISSSVAIIIEDNGVGIPEKDLGRIFERFYRVDKSRSRDLGGTGLGLSIAKEIVEAHNGSIRIESEFTKGTKVEIIFPAVI